MSYHLLQGKTPFRSLFVTQFMGALNDNLLKNALVVLVTYKGVSLWGLDAQALVALSGGIFILPFFLLSTTSGYLADGLQRASIVRAVKIAEVLIMLLASMAFLFSHFSFLLLALGLMGIHSTFFGPVKYSLIPDLVPETEIVGGNALIEMGTFLAILIGTIGGGVLISQENGPIWLSVCLISVSLLGLISGFGVPQTPVAQASLKVPVNPFPAMKQNIKDLLPQKAVWNSILGISWFWFFGAALMSLLPSFTKDVLGGSESVVTYFLALFTIGIAVGSLVCEKLSFEQVEIGVVPLGSLGMSLFLFDLVWNSYAFIAHTPPQNLLSLSQFLASPHSWRLSIDLFCLAIFGGIFTVPLYSLIQTRAQSTHRSRVVGVNNIVNAGFMVVAAVLIMLLNKLHWSPLEMFLLFGGLNILVSFYIYSIVPEFTLRFLIWVVGHAVYRIKHQGRANVRRTGPALLVCNHITFVDWLFISAVIKRPIRFVMYYKFASNFITRMFAKYGKVILIAGKNEHPEIFEKAFEQIAYELREGELVCVFPEGSLTPDGEIQEVKPGYTHVLQRNPVPLIPMTLKGMWGSMFSRMDRSLSAKRPRKFWKKVELVIDQPISAPYPDPNQLKSILEELYHARRAVRSDA